MEKPTFYITTPIYYPSGEAPHRPRLLHRRERRDRPLQAPARLRRDVPHRHRRARPEDRGQGQGRRRHAAAVRGQHRQRREGRARSLEADEHLQRPLHPHHRRLPRQEQSSAFSSKMYDNGDIYKGKYYGMYCTPCESFWTESQLVGRQVPRLRRRGQVRRGRSLFLPPVQVRRPRAQASRPTTDFLAAARAASTRWSTTSSTPGLEDLCVSRTSFTWGVPVDFDPEPRRLRLDRRAVQLHRPRSATRTTSTTISINTGPRTYTSSARRSSASTRSSGPRCS